jgi:hypothetical protein
MAQLRSMVAPPAELERDGSRRAPLVPEGRGTT